MTAELDRIDPRTMDLLGKCSTATLTTQLLKRGLRNTFMHGLFPLSPDSSRIVASAFTLRYIPAREDIDVLEAFKDPAHPQRLAIEEAPEGSVLVMDCRGEGRAASAGHILATRLQYRNVAGLITDGSIRDSVAIRQMGFPVFVASVSAMTNLALHHAVDMNVPIACGGVAVYPGDVIVSDEEGIVCIPRYLAAEIAEPSFEQESLEAYLRSEVANGASLSGTYPPDNDTLERYRRFSSP